MYYIIGTDEAGYGPNLGPLAVSATLWKVTDDALTPEQIYNVLSPVLTAKAWKKDSETVPVADSKKLHRHETLEPLETSLFAALYALKAIHEPMNSADFCDLLCGPAHKTERLETVWNDPSTERRVPVNLDWNRAKFLGNLLAQKMRETGVEIAGIRSELVFPRRFNDEVEAAGSKGVFLSDTTMRLVVYFWSKIQDLIKNNAFKNQNTANLTVENPLKKNEPPEVRILCDKHGGRNFYLPVLMEFFPDLPFCIVKEGRDASEYVHYGTSATLRIRFQAKGEALPPVALASIASKYLREISMERFNDWWRRRLPEIHPTAGYPLDAKRFRAEISDLMESIPLDWRAMWRNR